jgi:hypothetical protein
MHFATLSFGWASIAPDVDTGERLLPMLQPTDAPIVC